MLAKNFIQNFALLSCFFETCRNLHILIYQYVIVEEDTNHSFLLSL